MAKGFIDELRWRGMLQDSTPGVEEHLAQGPQRGYIGFDPTADSLHVGNLVQIMFLTHFQRSGHRAVALVGGATGMVGDPSGKKSERNLLDEDALRHNEACIKAQLQRFKQRRPVAIQLRLADPADLGQRLERSGPLGHHLRQGAVVEHHIRRQPLATGLLPPPVLERLQQGSVVGAELHGEGCRASRRLASPLPLGGR